MCKLKNTDHITYIPTYGNGTTEIGRLFPHGTSITLLFFYFRNRTRKILVACSLLRVIAQQFSTRGLNKKYRVLQISTTRLPCSSFKELKFREVKFKRVF